MKNKNQIIVCGCGDSAHHLLFSYDEDEPQVWLHYQLELLPWYERLWYGIKYTFGHQSRFGAYGELLIDKSNIHKFEEIIEHVKNQDC